jgi:hypothetical protein
MGEWNRCAKCTMTVLAVFELNFPSRRRSESEVKRNWTRVLSDPNGLSGFRRTLASLCNCGAEFTRIACLTDCGETENVRSKCVKMYV